MAQAIRKGSVDHPIIIGRRFIKKFGFKNITVEQFDIFIIDNRLTINPDSDDSTDPTYKQFKEERTRARGILNRAGAEMDEGRRYQITVMVPGQMYSVVPYGLAVVDKAANFGSQIQRIVAGKRRQIAETERKVEKILSYGIEDSNEMAEVKKVLALCSTQTEVFSDTMKAESHKFEKGIKGAFKLIDKLLIQYEADHK